MSEERTNVLNPAHIYKAFGLTISSCLSCPELLPATGDPEVTMVYGEVPRDLPGASNNGVRHQAIAGQLLLQVDGIARFLVSEGRRIVIERDPSASDDDVRLFLLGSAVGALLHQRGHLVLHGSMVRVDDGCVVFLGKSGVGKSTLAAALGQRGYPCLSDDVCAISIDENGVPYAVPAYPQAKLWVDSLKQLAIDSDSLRRVRPSLEKRAWRFEGDFSHDRVPVKRLFVLSPSRGTEGFELLPITGPLKIRVLRDYTYRVEFLKGLALSVPHFKQLAHLGARLEVTRVVRPENSFLLDELARVVEGAFRT